MVAVGTVLLLLAFFTRYIVFEITSILALLIGILFAFSSAESYIRAEVARRIASSALLPLSELVERLGYAGKVVYLPPAKGASTGRVLLSKSGDVARSLIESGQVDAGSDEGVLVSSPGEVLFGAVEEEFSDLRAAELDYFLEWLPRVLVDGLGLAARAEAVRNWDEVIVQLWSPSLGMWHQQPWVGKVCERVGCPVNGAVALALAKITGRAVFVSGCKEMAKSQITKMEYSLGPLVKGAQTPKAGFYEST